MESDEGLKWWHLAICQGTNDLQPGEQPHHHRDYFYEEYENDPVVAANMDEMCKSCPVRAMCRREGEENEEWGLWGGVYLAKGKIDQARNAHKTDADWEAVGGK